MLESQLWRKLPPHFPIGPVPEALPAVYLTAISAIGAGEGPIGANYLRLYSPEELRGLNEAYAVSEFAPGLLLFGSDCGGNGFAFDLRSSSPSVVRVPFIPLAVELIEALSPDLPGLLEHLLVEHADEPPITTLNESLIGREIHEITPVLFGGDPVDPKNKALVPPVTHAEICTFWNRFYRRLQGTTGGGA